MSDHDKHVSLVIVACLTVSLMATASLPQPDICQMLRDARWSWWHLILLGCW
jgi:hypothetical protein